MPISEAQRARRSSPEGRALRAEQNRRRRERARQQREPRRCPDCGTLLDYHKMLCEHCREAREALRRKRPRRATPRTKLEYTYGLSIDELNSRLATQGGVCAICGSELLAGADVPRWHKLQIDHDHRCCPGDRLKCGGKCIRGLVHGHCNRGVGQLGDDPAVYLRAAAYIAANNDRLGFGPDRKAPRMTAARHRGQSGSCEPRQERLDFAESA